MKPWNVACARLDGARFPLFGISTNIQEPCAPTFHVTMPALISTILY